MSKNKFVRLGKTYVNPLSVYLVKQDERGVIALHFKNSDLTLELRNITIETVIALLQRECSDSILDHDKTLQSLKGKIEESTEKVKKQEGDLLFFNDAVKQAKNELASIRNEILELEQQKKEYAAALKAEGDAKNASNVEQKKSSFFDVLKGDWW